MDYLDQKDITHFLAQELLYHQFIALEGLNSGVPTRTTPTLTPTTLRNIEQTFIELQSKPEPHENEAGFVPPLVHSIGNNQYVSASDATDLYANSASKSPSLWQSSLSQSSSDSNTRSTPPLTQKTNFINNTPQGSTRRNMGGRKPIKDMSISPEEEERRRIRRERNKAAAARCRKRRVDHTNSLIKEVEDLESKRQKLMDEQQQLKLLKEQLEYLLESHKSSPTCRRITDSPPDIKPFEHNYYDKAHERIKTESIEVMDNDDIFLLPSSPTKKIMLSQAAQFFPRPERPNSLNVAIGAPAPSNKKHESLPGIPITTPSHGMTFNFESLMGGGTGLTPVSGPLIPSCSTQQRNIPVSVADLSSPDNQLVSL